MIEEKAKKTKSGNIFTKIGKQIKRVPWYGWVCGVLFFALQFGFYNIAKPIINAWSYQWRIDPAIPQLDGIIPLVPYFFVQIYYFSWLFWIFAPIVVSVTKRENFLNYIIGLFASYVVGFCIFIFMPTYMDRTAVWGIKSTWGNQGDLVKEIANHKGFSYWMMNMMVGNDGGTDNYNLFPSFHCSISLYAYLGIRGQKEVSKGSKIYALILVPLICLSTIFTKQHYFVDILGGIMLSIICYAVTQWFNPGKAMVEKWQNILIIKKKKKPVKVNKKKS